MPSTEHYDPHGQSLLDYLHGDTAAVITIHSAGGQRADVPVAIFFRAPAAFPLEAEGLALCRGRTLDIGAGSGVHALALQARGLEVVALDFLLGRKNRQQWVRYYTATSIEISTSQPVAIQIDGEPVGHTPASFSIAPAALKVLVPQKIPRGLFSKD